MADRQAAATEDVPATTIHAAVRRAVAWNLTGQMTTQILRFVTGVVVARLLAPEDYGVAAVAVLIASASLLVGDFGIGSALVQSPSVNQRLLSTAFWASATFGLLLTLAGVLLAHPAAVFLGHTAADDLIAVAAGLFLVNSLASVPLALRSRAMAFGQVQVRYVSAVAVASLVAVVVAWWTHGPWALVMQQVVLATVYLSLLWARLGWRPSPQASWVDFKPLWRFGARVAAGRWLQLTEAVLTSLLIGRLVGISDLGAWTFAANLVILPAAFFAAPIADVLFSGFSRMQDDPRQIGESWLRWMRALAAASFPVLVAIASLAPEYVPLIFGEQWTIAVPLVQILTVLAMIRVLMKWNSSILDAVGRPGVTMYLSATSLITCAAAVLVGSRIGGAEAVAATYVVFAALFVEVPSFFVTLRHVGFPPSRFFGALAGIGVAAALMAAASTFLQMTLHQAGWSHVTVLAVAGLMGGLVYVGVLRFVAPDLWNDGWRVLGRLRRRA